MAKRAYIKHITSYYPNNFEFNNPENRITSKIGVSRRPIALPNECASDLAVEAAKIMFEKYKVNKEDIDALVLCTETPDHIMPATSCIIHGRLGLKTNCMCLDYNHGCTGYIYGLSISKALIESGQANNVLLLTADTLSKLIHPKDMRTKPLFGDAAAATLVSSTYSRTEYLRGFQFGTNGVDFMKIIVNYGMMRMKYASREEAFREIEDQYGNVRTDATVYMDGKGVVQFTQTVVPPMLKSILEKNMLSLDDIDNFIFHQANRFMLQTIQKACHIPDDGRYFNDCEDTGNTASATIPIAINKMQSLNIPLGKRALLMGFGVGLTWGGCIADLTLMDPEEEI